MNEKQQTGNVFDYLIDSFWAALPEQTADDLAIFKKDMLKGIRSAVDSLVDTEIECTDRHLENARRMRQERCQPKAESASPNPA
ncbi:MAG: hypothetical protein ABIP14_14050 [Blastocatellia bacterium]